MVRKAGCAKQGDLHVKGRCSSSETARRAVRAGVRANIVAEKRSNDRGAKDGREVNE